MSSLPLGGFEPTESSRVLPPDAELALFSLYSAASIAGATETAETSRSMVSVA